MGLYLPQKQQVMQKNAYKKRMKHYDDVLTGRRWWSHIYMKYLWRTDDNAIAREVLAMIPDDFRGKILDVPVGTAVFTAEKYRRMTDAEIVGLDFSQEMLAIAGERASQMQLRNLRLEQGDVGKLPYPDESFDCVLSMNGFHVFPDKPKAFAETFRVLKAGGLFCGCFYITGQRLCADRFVRHVLDRKGLFVPPHLTRTEAEDLLRSLYGDNVTVRNESSILIFKARKP